MNRHDDDSKQHLQANLVSFDGVKRKRMILMREDDRDHDYFDIIEMRDT